MPTDGPHAAIAPCHGSMRLVKVNDFNRKDEAACPFCTLSPKSERKIDRETKYYLLPNHRPQGVRQASKIDWSNPPS